MEKTFDNFHSVTTVANPHDHFFKGQEKQKGRGPGKRSFEKDASGQVHQLW